MPAPTRTRGWSSWSASCRNADDLRAPVGGLHPGRDARRDHAHGPHGRRLLARARLRRRAARRHRGGDARAHAHDARIRPDRTRYRRALAGRCRAGALDGARAAARARRAAGGRGRRARGAARAAGAFRGKPHRAGALPAQCRGSRAAHARRRGAAPAGRRPPKDPCARRRLLARAGGTRAAGAAVRARQRPGDRTRGRKGRPLREGGRAMKAERGSAVIMAMLVVAVATTLVAGALWQQSALMRETENERALAQARWLLRGAIDWAGVILQEDARTSSVDHRGEPWAVPLAEDRKSTRLNSSHLVISY